MKNIKKLMTITMTAALTASMAAPAFAANTSAASSAGAKVVQAYVEDTSGNTGNIKKELTTYPFSAKKMKQLYGKYYKLPSYYGVKGSYFKLNKNSITVKKDAVKYNKYGIEKGFDNITKTITVKFTKDTVFATRKHSGKTVKKVSKNTLYQKFKSGSSGASEVVVQYKGKTAAEVILSTDYGEYMWAKSDGTNEYTSLYDRSKWGWYDPR